MNPLLTPRDWQMTAHAEAAKMVGTTDYDAKMVEVRRYALMADELERMQAEVARLKSEMTIYFNLYQNTCDGIEYWPEGDGRIEITAAEHGANILKDRDAALARLAEFEKQGPVGWRWKIDDGGWQLEDHKPKTSHVGAIIEPVFAAAGASPIKWPEPKCLKCGCHAIDKDSNCEYCGAQFVEAAGASPQLAEISGGQRVGRTSGIAAIKTLERLGYTYHGDAQWKPPVGQITRGLRHDDGQDFIAKTNREHQAWLETFYAPDAPFKQFQMYSLWAWQEQERRKAKHTAGRAAMDLRNHSAAVDTMLCGLCHKDGECKRRMALCNVHPGEFGKAIAVTPGGRIEPYMGPFGADDPLYQQAIAIVREHKRCSISLVQRHLRIGYTRSAYMIEAMERAGIVTHMDQQGRREVSPSDPDSYNREVVHGGYGKRRSDQKPDDTEGGAL